MKLLRYWHDFPVQNRSRVPGQPSVEFSSGEAIISLPLNTADVVEL